MAPSKDAGEDLSMRRRRLRYRAWHRGTKEMDLVLGPFADAHLEGYGPSELDRLEALMDEEDTDLLKWVMGQEPVKVDRVLHDGDKVSLGEVTLTAHNTPGHTRGATTWETTIVDQGKKYFTVFPDGQGFNPGYHLTGATADYPGIADDYRRTHHFQEMLKPDMWFGFHTEYFNMEAKLKRSVTEGVNAWVDPGGYRQFIAGKKRAFEDEIDAEQGVAKK